MHKPQAKKLDKLLFEWVNLMNKKYIVNFFVFLSVVYVLGGVNYFFILNQELKLQHFILPTVLAFVLSITYTRYSILKSNFQLSETGLAELQKATGDLIEINESLEVFAHTVSHDLKSPLYAFSVLVAILEKDLEDEKYTHAQATLGQLKNTNNLMKNLIEKVLSYSRKTNFEIKNELINLNDLLEDVSNGFSLDESVKIDVRVDLLEIYFSEIALKQILSNLFENAIKYCDKEVCEITVECMAGESFITIRVSDNGPGIDPEFHKEIFKPFNRLNKKKEADGVGVGLAIVKKIAERTGGGISVNSQLGKGAEFNVIIKKVLPG
ncbi:MAG: HAMP domain-containing histidine kinase [Flavobacteriales bacterium]|nr:HAMP domain-containing histidine kinase [Flavobacteriales bacterium]